MTDNYASETLSPDEVKSLDGSTVLNFGTDWCGHCRAAEPVVARALADHPQVRHLKIEDGPGRRLGRAFRVKLWPTLVFLKNGEELDRVVRPTAAQPIADALSRLQ